MSKTILSVSVVAAAGIAATLLLSTSTPDAGASTAASCTVPTSVVPFGPRLDANMRVVVAVGAKLQVPVAGVKIAIAVSLTEAQGLNLASRKVPESMRYPNDGVAAGDHLSINLFQQQVGMGWFGSVRDGMRVEVAADSFYRHLLAVPGWEGLGFGEAAQAVQRSAFPARYATHEAEATAILNRVAGAAVPVSSGPAICQPATGAPAGISGKWVNPLAPAPYIKTSPFGPRLDPVLHISKVHKGQDMATPVGTPVHAECSGVVQLAGWDQWGGGNMTTLDCGGGITIKNMHQSKLLAVTGAKVVAGQVTGLSGDTGNSTGPHLHEQVEVNGVPTDPVVFMAARGVTL